MSINNKNGFDPQKTELTTGAQLAMALMEGQLDSQNRSSETTLIALGGLLIISSADAVRPARPDEPYSPHLITTGRLVNGNEAVNVTVEFSATNEPLGNNIKINLLPPGDQMSQAA